MKKFLPVLILLIASADLLAQNFAARSQSRDAIVSLGSGVTSYYGDLNNPGDIVDTDLNLNLGLQYFFHPRYAVRSELTWFNLRGDDSEADANGRVVRNLSFTSSNFEWNVVGLVNAFPNGIRFYQRSQLNFYGFAGIGVLRFNPKAEVPETDWNGNPLPDAGDKIALQPLQTEGVEYSRTTIVIPYGIGIRYMAGPFFNVCLEGGFRTTFTDYLDDVSTEYLLHSSLDGEPLRQALADRRHELGSFAEFPPLGLDEGNIRGNPNRNDNYFILNLKIEYYLPQNILAFNPNGRRKPHRNIQNRRRARRR